MVYTYFSSDDMRNLHEVIIYDICKVISWVAITFHKHLIINHAIIERDFSMNDVFELSLAIGNKHPNHIRLSAFYSLLNFTLTQIQAKSVVFSCLVLLSSLLYP